MEELEKKDVKLLIQALYEIVSELERRFTDPDTGEKRHFTPDGHLVGSIGECLVADMFGLKLMTASNKGFDALTRDGSETKVEIKTTQASSFAFRDKEKENPPHVVACHLSKAGEIEIVYNGPGKLVWDEIKDRKDTSNGQYQISVKKMRELNGHKKYRLP